MRSRDCNKDNPLQSIKPKIDHVGNYTKSTLLMSSKYPHYILYYNYPEICMSLFANCRSQCMLDCLGICVKLSASTVVSFSHEFESQFGRAMCVHAKNTQTSKREHRQFIPSRLDKFGFGNTVVPVLGNPLVTGRCTATLSMSRHMYKLNYLRSADTCITRTRTVFYWL